MVSVLKSECSVIKEHRQKGNGRCLRNPDKWGMVRDRGLSHRFLGVEGILVLISEFQLCPVIKNYIVLIYNYCTCQGQCVYVCVCACARDLLHLLYNHLPFRKDRFLLLWSAFITSFAAKNVRGAGKKTKFERHLRDQADLPNKSLIQKEARNITTLVKVWESLAWLWKYIWGCRKV